jgi:hypothetical protein
MAVVRCDVTPMPTNPECGPIQGFLAPALQRLELVTRFKARVKFGPSCAVFTASGEES